jgi:hypothetical protein
MAIAGNPLVMAREISDGFRSLTPGTLKRYTPADLKVINTSLQQILRETRAEVSPPDDAEATRRKNLRMQRLNQAMLALTNYCRQQRIPL